jgi:hypothetical protein
MRPRFAIGAVSAPRFAKKRNAQLLILYCANTIGTTALVPLNLFFQNSPIFPAVINGNEYDKEKMVAN